MMLYFPDPTATVFVFDLDDTLYQEADYRESGLREICLWIQKYYEKSIAAQLNVCAAQGEDDLLGAACHLAGLPESVKESLLWIYRLHVPNIQLKESVKQTIQYLESVARVAILTDGRSVTQRLKLKALGLAHLPAYISEDYNSEKPHPLRFQKLMQDMPAQHYVYLADNPKKDFVAANTLGWMTIGIRGTEKNIHRYNNNIFLFSYLPVAWIDNICEVNYLVAKWFCIDNK